jgi:uncharacterized protein YdeI (YjbR/CyaY-like superfamily)
MKSPIDAEVLACTDASQWESWLADHHDRSTGIWLLIAKKGSDQVSVRIGDALDVALCYGWIDSQRKGHDTDFYLQRYSPRRPGSPWSRLNVERVEALTEAGRMRGRGLAEVAAAQADGRWGAAYAPQRNAELPPDFAAALDQNERARTSFEQLDKTGQYAVILPILKAMTPAIRLMRIQKAIAKLEASGRSMGQRTSTPAPARLEWETTHTDVRSERELDQVLDRLTAEARATRPFVAQLFSADGASLGMGLGRDSTIMSYIPANLDPPYLHSVGEQDGDPLVFYFGGDWSEFPRRQAVPVSEGREAMRRFFANPSLPANIEWEED